MSTKAQYIEKRQAEIDKWNTEMLEILQKRYAKGKITKEGYEQMKHDLTA